MSAPYSSSHRLTLAVHDVDDHEFSEVRPPHTPSLSRKLPAVDRWTSTTCTVEWSRVRYTGFSFLAVEAVAGPSPVLKVSALAESGERVDHFEVRRTA
ncbi:hypothetical protein [Streptomyces sp. NPDC012508]|uniref:hypothetical protein n=1 Tax=Streptomyces sp. NPDC012508 TaxID=3364837 RepID=UPI003684A8F2